MSEGALAIVHEDRFTERIGYLCEHGRTDKVVTTEGVDATVSAVAELVRSHRQVFTCTCPVSMVREWWVRIPDWIEAMHFDMQPHIRAKIRKIYGTPEEERAYQANLNNLEIARKLGCPTCAPGVELTVDSRVELVHSRYCPRADSDPEVIDGARRYRAWSN